MPTSPHALTEPRSFAGVAFRIGAMAFLPFSLFMAWLVSVLSGYAFGEVLPFALAGGVVFGTVFGFNNARFLQVETITLNVEDTYSFIARVNIAISQIGYYPTIHSGDYHGYRPSFLTGWAAGWISVQLMEKKVVIVGPRVFVKKIIERLGLTDQGSRG